MLTASALRMLALAIAFPATMFACFDCSAQSYPSRPVRMVYLYAPGGNTDALARFTAQKLGDQLGQQVIVENKPGAGGLLGIRDTLRSRPLGYSLLYTTPALVGNLHTYRDPQYKLEDFTVLGPLGLAPFVLIVNSNVLPVKTVQEFIAYAKANPGKLNYGSISPSAGGSILSERLKVAAGLELVGIPFKGGEAASVALLAGQIQVYYAVLGVARVRLKNQQIRALAVAGEFRTNAIPDTPTFKEVGYPNMIFTSWNAVVAPSAVPQPILTQLQGAMAKVTALPEMVGQLEKIDAEPWKGTLEEFSAKLKQESTAMAEEYKRLNIPTLD